MDASVAVKKWGWGASVDEEDGGGDDGDGKGDDGEYEDGGDGDDDDDDDHDDDEDDDDDDDDHDDDEDDDDDDDDDGNGDGFPNEWYSWLSGNGLPKLHTTSNQFHSSHHKGNCGYPWETSIYQHLPPYQLNSCQLSIMDFPRQPGTFTTRYTPPTLGMPRWKKIRTSSI